VDLPTSGAPNSEWQVADDKSDDDLVAALAGGDEQALLALYSRHVRPVYALVLRMLHDDDVAEEVVQDAFLRIWRGASDFDPRRSTLRSWILSIAHHATVDELRRRRARPISFTRGGRSEAAPGHEPRATDPAVDPVAVAEGDETGAAVRAALAALPGAQRAAIELAYFSGLSQSEIAEATGVPLGTIKSRIRFGMLALQAELEQRGYAPLRRYG